MNEAAVARVDDSPTEGPSPSGHTAVWIAAPIALFIAVVVEAMRAPHLESASAFVGHGLVAALPVLWAPLLASIGAALLVTLAPRQLPRAATVVLAVAIAAAATLHCHVVVSAYEPLRFHPLFLGAFGGLFVFLLVALLSATRASRGAFAAWSIGTIGVGGFVLSSVLSRALYVREYQPLYLGMMEASYLVLHAGLAALGGLFYARVRIAKRVLYGALAITASLAALAITWSRAEAGAAELSAFRNFTVLGRADAIEHASRRPAATHAAPSQTFASPPMGSPPDEVLTRFEQMSGLPSLPADFRLDRYDVLLISIDATSCRDTSICSPSRGVTPRLAAFARQHAYAFTHAYSAGPGTLSSMASIMAMTYPSLAQLHFNTFWHGRLEEAETTVAEVLGASGYQTFYAGHNYKGHFRPGGKIAGLHQGFTERRFASAHMHDPNIDTSIRRLAIERIDAHRTRGGRFFGWIFFESPHEPYLPRGRLTESAAPRALYRGELAFADQQLGRLLDHIETEGMLESTIVVILGDHGEAFGEHERRYHSDVYDEVTHVPLVIHVPGARPATIDTPTSLLHVFPWLLVHGPAPVRSFAEQRLREHIVPMLEQTRGAVVCEMPFEDYRRVSLVDATHRVVRDDASGYVELYDLREDPAQLRNVFDAHDATSRGYLERLAGYDALRARIGRR